MLLASAGQLTAHRAQAVPIPPPPPEDPPDPGGGGAGGFPEDSFAQHTGVGSWVMVDTTDLWTANGGDVTPGTLLMVDDGDGNMVSATAMNYTQPTPAAPIVFLMLKIGTRTLSLGAHEAEGDVHWRGWPWKARFGGSPGNDYYFDPHPEQDVAPTEINDPDATPWQAIFALNNGYSNVPDGTGLDGEPTSCVFCVVPGDQPSHLPPGVTGAPGIPDTRSEFVYAEPFSNSLGGLTGPTGPIAGSPPLGIDLTGAISRTVRFWRCDVEVPSEWEAPVTVQNSDGEFSLDDGTGQGYWPRERGATEQLAIRGDILTPVPLALTDPVVIGTPGYEYPIDNIVRNSQIDPYSSGAVVARAIDSNNLSNLMENYGPATITFFSPPGSGQFRVRLNFLSLGVFLVAKSVDTFTVAFDTRYPLILEYLPHLYATTDGDPYIVQAGTPNPYNNNNPWSATRPVAPYGPPPGEPGGGYVRLWRLINNVWTCTSAGHQLAVPGTPTIVDGEIVGDPTTGANAGKIYGPNVKCTAANLLTGPGGSSGVVISAGQSPPFDMTINTPVHGTLHTTGGILAIDGELMLYSTYTSSQKKARIIERALDGPATAADHSANALVAAMENWPSVNPGINAQVRLPVPLAVRHWPMMIGPTFDSVAGPPAVNYP